MGPRLDSRGREPVDLLEACTCGASMGPRLDSRGRVYSTRAYVSRLRLQWGRGWTAAEGFRSDLWLCAEHMLQWGRGWTAAEGGFELTDSLPQLFASMGPRLDSRGRVDK